MPRLRREDYGYQDALKRSRSLQLSEEEKDRLAIAAGQGNRLAEETLILCLLRLVIRMANKRAMRIGMSSADQDDLTQSGIVGLIALLRDYVERPGYHFSVRAYFAIEKGQYRWARRWLRKRKREIGVGGRVQRGSEIEGDTQALRDYESAIDPRLAPGEGEADAEAIRQLLDGLSASESRVVTLRLGLNAGDSMTRKRVAEVMEMSECAIQRLEDSALEKMGVGRAPRNDGRGLLCGGRGCSYRGVQLLKSTWRASIGINRKVRHLGCYATAVEAARAYDLAVVQHGLDRPLNFPDAAPVGALV